MLGICVLTYNCSYISPSSPTEVNIDSFSINLTAFDLEKDISFDSIDVVDTPILEEVFFNSKTIRSSYGQLPIKVQPSFASAAYARREQFVSGIANLAITSNKDIHFKDSLITAGTNLLNRCSFYIGSYHVNPWATAEEFLRRTKSGEELEPFTMRISTPLNEPIDQNFTFTFTHKNGEMVSAVSPRVLAQ